MRLRWPSRGQIGRATTQIGGAVVAAALIGVVSTWIALAGIGTGSDPDGSASPSTVPGAADDECPRAQRPLVDLNVQSVTDRGPDGVMSRRQVADLVDLAAEAGAEVISTAASFRALHPVEGQPYRYPTVDLVVDEALRRDLKVRLILVGMPDWALDQAASARQAPRSEAELAQWREFVSALMVHLAGKVDYVEVWNEPNLSKWWPTGPDPVEFMRLVEATRAAVERIDADVQVITGGLAGNDIGFLDSMYDAVDRLGLDGIPADLLGVHPFSDAAPPDELDAGRVFERDPFGTMDQNFRGFEALHEIMAAHGDGDLGVFITQFGYSATQLAATPEEGDAVRATYLPVAFDAATCAGSVEGMSWYNLHPTAFDPAAWTLVDPSGRPNQTYQALKAWANEES